MSLRGEYSGMQHAWQRDISNCRHQVLYLPFSAWKIHQQWKSVVHHIRSKILVKLNAVHECYGVKMKRHQTTLGEDLLGRSLCASDTKIWPTLQVEQQFHDDPAAPRWELMLTIALNTVLKHTSKMQREQKAKRRTRKLQFAKYKLSV